MNDYYCNIDEPLLFKNCLWGHNTEFAQKQGLRGTPIHLLSRCLLTTKLLSLTHLASNSTWFSLTSLVLFKVVSLALAG